MTVEQAWDALTAAGRIAEAFGVQLEPTIRPHALRLAFYRGRQLVGVLSVTEAALNAAARAEGVRQLLEHEVAQYLTRKGSLAS